MNQRLLLLSFTVFLFFPGAAQTLDECQRAAALNYPLIRQCGLAERTAGLTVSNILKGWLPQVSVSAQATYQSDVASWPGQEAGERFSAMGLGMKGLRKDQYKIGIDVSQTVYDGGAAHSQQAVARQRGAVEEAQTEVALYEVRRRVNEMYFGLLLTEAQIRLNGDLQELLSGSERKLLSMFERGTAAESDYQAVRAERLGAAQEGERLQSQRRSLAAVLGAFCGIEVTGVVKPLPPAPPGQAAPALLGSGGAGRRPELRVADAQLRLADVQERGLDAALRPRLSVFASGFYGYPGLNMFEDMMSHGWSLNGIVGARLSWNIGALYTRKNDKARLDVQRSVIGVQRETFLFNNNLEQIQQNERIRSYQRLMAADAEIISLRSAVRRAAESKLAHGIIDVNDLVKEINAENGAKVQQTVHEIEMLKEMYDLKFTTDN